MKLILNVISVYNRPPGQKMAFTFDEKGGTIGRKMSNSWVLPDEQRHLSGTHAKIEYEAQQFYILDTSTNGVFIDGNARSLGSKRRAKLEDRMRVTMGGYEIEVSLSANSPVVDSQNKPASDPFSDFDDDLNNPQPAKSPGSNRSSDGSLSQQNSAKHRIPLQTSSGSNDPFSDLDEFSSGLEDKDDPQGKQPQSSVIPELDSFFKPPEISQQKDKDTHKEINEEGQDDMLIPDDWGSGANDAIDDLLVGINDPDPFSSSKETRPEPENTIPPDVRPEKPRTTHKSTDVSTPSKEVSLHAFLKGAGLDTDVFSQGLSPQQLELAGTLFRTAIQGTMDVLHSRAEIKNEMHMDMTAIQSVHNNPIKFSVNVDEALKRLLLGQSQSQSFMGPERALLEAFDDIKAHQIAIIAGIQASLVYVLKRFEPEKLMQRLEEESPIAANIPIHKQAKLWEKFEALYEVIEGEAEEDFNRLFGQEFSRAYDEQVEKLRMRRKNSLSP